MEYKQSVVGDDQGLSQDHGTDVRRGIGISEALNRLPLICAVSSVRVAQDAEVLGISEAQNRFTVISVTIKMFTWYCLCCIRLTGHGGIGL